MLRRAQRFDARAGLPCATKLVSSGASAHLFQGLPYPSGNYTYGPADRAEAPREKAS
jgi:hypothetical protein